MSLGLKAVASLAIAGGVIVTAALPSQAEPSDSVSALGVKDSIANRVDEGASRSAARSVALEAPAHVAPAQGSIGVTGVKAVKKPKPKPSESADGSTKSDSNGSSDSKGSSGGSSGSGSTTAYAAAGASKGLTPNAQRVYSVVRSATGISNIGGYRRGDWGDHGSGRAVDVMVTNAGQGNTVSALLMPRAGELRIKYIIWQQRIWFPGRGWRGMADRGSATANHYDHVHVSVY